MWHVDEGGLHAFLDDALDALPRREAERIREHLAACDTCRRQLGEEREVRAEARAILALASPDVGDLPTLPELAERAGSQGTGGASSGRWWRLRWAASIVAAGAIGWVLGGRSMPSGAVGEVSGAREVAPPALRKPAPQVFPEEAGSPLDSRGKTRALQAEAAAVERVESRPEVPRSVAKAVAAAGGAPVRAPAATGVAAPGGDAGALMVDDVAFPRAFARPSESLPTPQFEPLFSPASLGLSARVAAPAADSPARASGRATGVVGALAPAAKVWSGGPRGAQLAGTRLLVTSGGAAPADAVVRQAELPAVAFTPPASLIVPGLEVVGVSWLRPGGLGGGVRVMQLLESGDTLELIRLPAGSSPPQEEGFRTDGRTEIVQARSGGWLIARARLPRAALQSLVGRLGGG